MKIKFICHQCGGVTEHDEEVIRELLDDSNQNSDVEERLKKIEDVNCTKDEGEDNERR